MPEVVRRPLSRSRVDVTEPVARTAEPVPRPEWEGLFREPDWPPYVEDEAD
jgi:hypothetical protein